MHEHVPPANTTLHHLILGGEACDGRVCDGDFAPTMRRDDHQSVRSDGERRSMPLDIAVEGEQCGCAYPIGRPICELRVFMFWMIGLSLYLLG